MKMHDHQQIPQRIAQPGEEFKLLNKTMSEGEDFLALANKHQCLDDEIKAIIFAAANSIGHSDYIYQLVRCRINRHG